MFPIIAHLWSSPSLVGLNLYLSYLIIDGWYIQWIIPMTNPDSGPMTIVCKPEISLLWGWFHLITTIFWWARPVKSLKVTQGASISLLVKLYPHYIPIVSPSYRHSPIMGGCFNISCEYTPIFRHTHFRAPSKSGVCTDTFSEWWINAFSSRFRLIRYMWIWYYRMAPQVISGFINHYNPY